MCTKKTCNVSLPDTAVVAILLLLCRRYVVKVSEGLLSAALIVAYIDWNTAVSCNIYTGNTHIKYRGVYTRHDYFCRSEIIMPGVGVSGGPFTATSSPPFHIIPVRFDNAYTHVGTPRACVLGVPGVPVIRSCGRYRPVVFRSYSM